MANSPFELRLEDSPQVVLAGTMDERFDSYSVAFPSIFREGKYLFLYYTGSPNRKWSFASIGVAKSVDGLDFERAAGPIIANQSSSDFAFEAVTPAVARVGSDYFMILAGRKHRYNKRVVGIAHSDTPEGPFTLIKQIRVPAETWEGFGIDNGTTLVREDEDTLILYYSNCAPSLTGFFVRKMFRRRIGLLKIRIGGTAPDSIRVLYQKTNPIEALHGRAREWNESVFCPGYLSNAGTDVLFFAASRYSRKPWIQSIGYAVVASPYLDELLCQPMKLVEQADFGSDPDLVLGFDSPCPYVIEEGRMFLFYSVVDRRTNSWKIMRNTISFNPHE